MEKSALYFYFKTSYNEGKSFITTKETLKNAVVKNYITEEEYKEITGIEYVVV